MVTGETKIRLNVNVKRYTISTAEEDGCREEPDNGDLQQQIDRSRLQIRLLLLSEIPTSSEIAPKS